MAVSQSSITTDCIYGHTVKNTCILLSRIYANKQNLYCMLCHCLHHHILYTYILFIAMTKLLKCYIDSVWCKECTSHESTGLYIYFLHRQFSSVMLSIRPWKKCSICRRTQIMFVWPREAFIANLCLTRVQKPLVT